MSEDYKEVFSSEVPIPESKRNKVSVPKADQTKPKRKYTRKIGEPTLDCSEEPIMLAEGLFEDSQLSHYYMVKSFLEICAMVESKNHKRLAQILEGLISK